MADGDKLLYTGALLFCNKGCLLTTFTASIKKYRLYGPFVGTTIDNKPCVNIPLFGACAMKKGSPCFPPTLTWTKFHNGALKIEKRRPLLVTSECRCAKGGTIKIFDSRKTLLATQGADKFLKKAGDALLKGVDQGLGNAILGPVGAIMNLTGHQDWTEAFGRGFRKGVVSSAKGLYYTVRHPIETAKGLGKMVAIASAYVPSIKIDKSGIGLDNPDEKLKAIDKTLGTDCYQTKEAIKHAVTQEIDTKVIHGSGTDRAEVAGEATEFVAEAIFGSKGAGAVAKVVKGSELAAKLAKSRRIMNMINKAKQLPKAVKGVMRTKKRQFSQ